jgi:hypothetical protein
MTDTIHHIEWNIDIAKILGVILLFVLVIMGKDILNTTTELKEQNTVLSEQVQELHKQMDITNQQVQDTQDQVKLQNEIFIKKQIEDANGVFTRIG